eukprot:scaffold104162_cov21-Prasinocladus_malaysianus.AAC.1
MWLSKRHMNYGNRLLSRWELVTWRMECSNAEMPAPGRFGPANPGEHLCDKKRRISLKVSTYQSWKPKDQKLDKQ